MAFARFMASPFGRALRIILGSAIVTGAVIMLASGGDVVWSIVLFLIGVLLFIVGAVNMCPLAVLFGGPLSGQKALDSKR